jgi:hypothetical protein
VLSSASPADGAINVPTHMSLQWSFVDPEADPLTYDVYFGTSPSPPLVADHISATSFNPGPLATSTYYRWRIVARDPAGHETSMAVRAFITTSVSGGAPFTPSNPSPPHNGTTLSPTPTLTWQGGDPDGGPVHYEVYFAFDGTSLVYLGTTTSPSFQVQQSLVSGVLYHWYVIAYDNQWYTQGPLWSFSVGISGVPVAFTSFAAVQNGSSVDINWKLTSDESMESYALYRREKSAPSIQIAQGRADASDSYRDMAVEPGATYSYELVIRTSDGDLFRSPVATVSMASVELTLHQNVPNPFNPQTTIRYELPSPAPVRLLILDVNGRLVRTLVNEQQTAGPRQAIWNGRDDTGTGVSSGVYFYVLEAGKDRLTRKLVLLK